MSRHIQTIDDIGNDDGTIKILQLSSPTCVKCPAVTDELKHLNDTFEFTWLHCNVHECPDVSEHFEVTKLPAIVVIEADKTSVHQQIRPFEIAVLLRNLAPVKLIDDF